MGAEINKGVLVWTSINRSPELRSALRESSIPYVLADDRDALFSQYCHLVGAENEPSRVFGNIWVAAVMMVDEFPVETNAFPWDIRIPRMERLRDVYPDISLYWEFNPKAGYLQYDLSYSMVTIFKFNGFREILPTVKKSVS